MLRACLRLNYHGRMEELPGAFGSSASLALRLGQTVFSTASLLFMCLDVDFYGYTAFCYLVTVMGLVIPWSITLLVVDAYSVFIKCLPFQRRLVMIIFLGDMILSYLSLAAACSTASVTDLLLDADRSYCPAKLCGRYQLSAAMAFLSWFLSSASYIFFFHVNKIIMIIVNNVITTFPTEEEYEKLISKKRLRRLIETEREKRGDP